MQLFVNLVKIDDLGSHFGAHWILKGGGKSNFFENSKTENNDVQETGREKHDCLIDFWC